MIKTFIFAVLFLISCTGCPSQATPPAEPAPALVTVFTVPTATPEDEEIDCAVTFCAPPTICDPVVGCVDPPPAILWQPFERRTLLEIQTSGKCAVFYFSNYECPDCSKLEETVFKNESIINNLNSRFISVWSLPDPEIHNLWQVEVFPSIFVFPKKKTMEQFWSLKARLTLKNFCQF